MRMVDLRTLTACAPTNVDVWHCTDCQSFHIKIMNLQLVFNHDEFAMFLQAIGECYFNETATPLAKHSIPQDEAEFPSLIDVTDYLATSDCDKSTSSGAVMMEGTHEH